MRPEFQERHFDYVLGPNQDSRLASIAAGAVVEKIKLVLDADAPFVLRGRAVRAQYSDSASQATLQGLKTRWSGPVEDYRQQYFVPEALQAAQFGQVGNFGVVFPGIVYPPNSVLFIDVYNSGSSAITNLSFYWRGVKLFPWGAVPAYTYPPKFAGLPFAYPVLQTALGVNETRQNQIFTVKPDADFVIRGGQATKPTLGAGVTANLVEVALILKDFSKKPYSNDYVPFDILFGSGNWPATIPYGTTPNFFAPAYGTGPSQPGLFYPEIYVPKNHQLIYDIQRSDGAGVANVAADVTFNLIGQKVFAR